MRTSISPLLWVHQATCEQLMEGACISPHTRVIDHVQPCLIPCPVPPSPGPASCCCDRTHPLVCTWRRGGPIWRAYANLDAVLPPSPLLLWPQYQAMYEESIKNPEGFWGEHGKRLTWSKPYTKARAQEGCVWGVRNRWVSLEGRCAKPIRAPLPYLGLLQGGILLTRAPSINKLLAYA